MGCYLCCPEDDDVSGRVDSTRRQHNTNIHPSGGDNSRQRSQAGGSVRSRFCDICGIYVDPALLDGHRETCRANHRRYMARQQQQQQQEKQQERERQPGAPSDEPVGPLVDTALSPTSHNEEEQCVVCLDRPRCYAFLPCGHIACCQECAKCLEVCPLCRQWREGLCYVSSAIISQYHCKHCKLFIAPTLFDGHREVCGMRQRQRQTQDANGVAADGPQKDTLTSPPPQSAVSVSDVDSSKPVPSGRVCLECGKVAEHLALSVPCGHCVLCLECAGKRTTCPVCLSDVTNTITAYYGA